MHRPSALARSELLAQEWRALKAKNTDERRSPDDRSKPRGKTLAKLNAVGISMGFEYAEAMQANALSSAAAIGGRLRRMVSAILQRIVNQ